MALAEATPAWQASRVDQSEAMKEGRGGGAAARGRLGRTLVVSQVALTLVLLLAAGLITRSFVQVIVTGCHRSRGSFFAAECKKPDWIVEKKDLSEIFL